MAIKNTIRWLKLFLNNLPGALRDIAAQILIFFAFGLAKIGFVKTAKKTVDFVFEKLYRKKDDFYLFTLGYIYEIAGELEKALKIFEKAAKRDTEFYFEAALISEELGNNEKAIQYYNELLKLRGLSSGLKDEIKTKVELLKRNL